MQTILLLLGGIVAVLLALKLVAYLLVQQHGETLDFRGPVHAVEIEVGAGEVTVRGDDRRDARVRRTTRHSLRRPRPYEHVDDGVLRLLAPTGMVQYEIDVPASASVSIRAASASATVIGMHGRVELRAGAGSLEGRALAAPELRASTSAGSIRLSFDQQPGDVEVATHAGDVDLRLPHGPYDVRTVGDADVRVPTAEGARCRVRARARSVDISPR